MLRQIILDWIDEQDLMLTNMDVAILTDNINDYVATTEKAIKYAKDDNENAELKKNNANLKEALQERIDTIEKLERKIEALGNLRAEAEWSKAEIAKLDGQIARLKFMNGELYKMGKGLCE